MTNEFDQLRQEIDEAAQHKVLMSVSDSLEQFTDQELRDELKRRAAERRLASSTPHCRDCKHCGEGLCTSHQWHRTAVCFLKPKPQAEPDRYYATLHSRKACDKFEPK